MAFVKFLLFETATPAQQAHSLGLEYGGFGRWLDPKKPGKAVAYTINDKLVRASGEKEKSKEKKSGSESPKNDTSPEASTHDENPEKQNLGRANILNFDNHLLSKDVLITIHHNSGQETLVTPTEFNQYNKHGKKQGDKVLFKKTAEHTTVSEYGLVAYNKLIQRLHSDNGTFYILCEKGGMSDIVSYLHSLDIVKNVILVPTDMNKPEKKANFVDNKLKKGYTQINFFDNDAKDISAINKLKGKHKEFSATLNARLLNSVVM